MPSSSSCCLVTHHDGMSATSSQFKGMAKSMSAPPSTYRPHILMFNNPSESTINPPPDHHHHHHHPIPHPEPLGSSKLLAKSPKWWLRLPPPSSPPLKSPLLGVGQKSSSRSLSLATSSSAAAVVSHNNNASEVSTFALCLSIVFLTWTLMETKASLLVVIVCFVAFLLLALGLFYYCVPATTSTTTIPSPMGDVESQLGKKLLPRASSFVVDSSKKWVE